MNELKQKLKQKFINSSNWKNKSTQDEESRLRFEKEFAEWGLEQIRIWIKEFNFCEMCVSSNSHNGCSNRKDCIKDKLIGIIGDKE